MPSPEDAVQVGSMWVDHRVVSVLARSSEVSDAAPAGDSKMLMASGSACCNPLGSIRARHGKTFG